MTRMFRKGFVPPTVPGFPPWPDIWRMSLEERLALPPMPARKSLPIWVLNPQFRVESWEDTAQWIEKREGPEAGAKAREGWVEAGIEADQQWEEYLAGRLTLDP